MYDELIQEDDDRAWRKDGERNGWTLPPKAPWPLRLRFIRSFRAGWLRYRAEQAAQQWSSVGIGVGGVNPYDHWVLYAVHRGWC